MSENKASIGIGNEQSNCNKVIERDKRTVTIVTATYFV